MQGLRLRGRRRAMLVAIVLCAFASSWTGCGGQEESSSSVPSMLGGRGTSGNAREGADDPLHRFGSSPVVESLRIEPPQPSPGRVVEARAQAFDADGNPARVRFLWRTARGVELGDGNQLETRGMEAGTMIELVAVASDGSRESDAEVLSFRLRPPSIEIAMVAIDDSAGRTPGARLSAIVESTDERGERYDTELEWLVNGQLQGRDRELETSGFMPGDVIELRAVIDSARGRSRPVTSRGLVLDRGAAPKIVSQPAADLPGGLFEYRVQGRSDAPHAELQYSLIEGPEGMSVEPETGLVRWRPTTDQRGRFDVEIAVLDQWGSGSAQSFTITTEDPASPPARAR